jgi:taurine dioxygenase
LSVGAAYDSLSDGLKATLEGLQAHHTNEHVFGKTSGYAADDDRFHNPEATGGAVHPVVARHPMTGRKLLYVNAAFTTHFVGWTPEESQPLLNFLYQHVAEGPFSYEFEWEPGSIAMWDNRSTWHWALNNYAGQRRLMHRITLAGDKLSGVDAVEAP